MNTADVVRHGWMRKLSNSGEACTCGTLIAADMALQRWQLRYFLFFRQARAASHAAALEHNSNCTFDGLLMDSFASDLAPQNADGPMRLEYFKDANLVGVAPCNSTIYLDGCGGVVEVCSSPLHPAQRG